MSQDEPVDVLALAAEEEADLATRGVDADPLMWRFDMPLPWPPPPGREDHPPD